MADEVKIISIDDMTPSYTGYSDIVKFGDKYYQTSDGEGY